MNRVVNDDLTAMTSGCNQHGIAVVMDRKEAQNGAYDRVHKTNPQHRPRVGIWNGDRKWPAPATSSLNFCTPQSLLRRILIADSADDVQHYQFDEIHDLSHWGILLLSYLLHLLDERIELRIYPITATPDTLLAEAILRAAQERGRLGTIALGFQSDTREATSAAHSFPRTPTSDGAQSYTSPSDRTEELPDSVLPTNFSDMKWEKQTVHCALEMRDWANKR